MAFLDETGLAYFWNQILARLNKFVPAESGKGLSTNDYTTEEKEKLAGIEDGANKTIVDAALSSTSTNPVQNKVINTKLDSMQSDIDSKVPSTRTVNGKALSSDITLSASDVGALPNTTVIPSVEDLATKAALDSHINNTDIHVTIDKKNAWDAKANVPCMVQISLLASGWDSSTSTQTVTVNGVVADETAQLIIPKPARASQSAYYKAGIMYTEQDDNSLTFTASTIPTEDLTVYVVIQEVYVNL